MKKVSINPDQYLEELPEEVHGDMKTLDKVIVSVFGTKERVLWTGKFWGGSEQNIIGYGDYSIDRPKQKIEWFKVGLALQKNYISIYVIAAENGKYLAEQYGKDLGKVKVGKSNISFKKAADIDTKKLKDLLKRAKKALG